MTAESLRISFENEAASLRSEMTVTAESLRVAFTNDIASVRSELTVTAESLRVAFTNDVASVRSELSVTAESLRSSFSDDISSVRSSISQQADRISLVVEGTGENAQIKPASIVASINNGASTIKISADHVDVDGILTVTNLKTKMADVDDLTIAGPVRATYFYISGSPPVSVNQGVYDVQIVSAGGNSYKLQKQTYANGTWADAGTFSRAISSASWDWVGGAAKVTLSPQNQTYYSTAIDAIQQNGSATWDADKKGFSVNIDVDDSQGTTVFSDSLHFGALTAWNDGHDKGSPSSGTAGGRTAGVSALVHDFTITCADGTTKTIQIDCSSIYSTARSGYSPGTYTQVTRTAVKTSVTRAHTGTLITNGHYEYLRGSSISGYKRGSSGPKIKRWGSGTLYPNPNGTGGMNREWFYSDSGGTQYYESGGSYSGYADGGSTWVYDAGDAITYYLSSELESVTLYRKD